MKREKSIFRKVLEAVLGFYCAIAIIGLTILLGSFLFGLL